MALRLRGRRSLSLLNQFLYNQQKSAAVSPSVSHLLHVTAFPTVSSSTRLITRPFTSTTSLFMSYRGKTFDPETDEIGPDTVLFEGCDYNHWLITIDFPKDANLSREQMIETYVNTAAQIFGSVEEAKKKIYALSTTTYQGFQVICTEETSEKFKGLPGVVFVLPDSYIDPVNKEYGGDKYVNGEIFPRPPPVHYGRRNYGDRRPREQNYGPPPPPQQNYGPPPPPHQQNCGPPPPPRQQNYGPPPPPPSPPQQNFTPPPNQNFGVPPQQNFAPPPNQNFRAPPQQNYGPPPQQNYSPPPHQNYRPSPQQNFGNPPSQSQHQDYVPSNQQNYGHPQNFPHQQNLEEKRGPMPHNNALGGSGGANQVPSYGGNFNSGKAGNQYPQGQQDFHPGNFPNHTPPEQKAFPQDNTYGAPQR